MLVTASTLRAVIGGVRRFPSPRHLVGYLGLNPKVRQLGTGPPATATPRRRDRQPPDACSSRRPGRPPAARACCERSPGASRPDVGATCHSRSRPYAGGPGLTSAHPRRGLRLRTSLDGRKRRRPELAAGRPGANLAERQSRLGRQRPPPLRASGRGAAEAAYRRLVADGRRAVEAGCGRDTGARVFEAVWAASSAADLKAPAVRALTRRSPAPRRISERRLQKAS